MMQWSLLLGFIVGCAPPEPHNAAEARAYHLDRFRLDELPRVGAGGDSLTLWLSISQAFDSTAVLVLQRADGEWTAAAYLQAAPERRASRRSVPVAAASEAGVTSLSALVSLPLRPSRPDSIVVLDGCSITAELRDASGYREWYYNNPWSFRTAPDSIMIAVVERALQLVGIPVRCGTY